MDNKTFFDFASGRRSIRKYTPEPVPEGEIRYFIESAVTAPSGCNSQCWKFVAIRDRAVMEEIARAVDGAFHALIAADEKSADAQQQFAAQKSKAANFFLGAPLVIAVFMTPLTYYDQKLNALLREKGYDYEAGMRLWGRADILSVGAAVQNLLLAVYERGYGACWMNEPAVAAEQIRRILRQSETSRFLSLIPVGRPAYAPRHKIYKPFDEICEII